MARALKAVLIVLIAHARGFTTRVARVGLLADRCARERVVVYKRGRKKGRSERARDGAPDAAEQNPVARPRVTSDSAAKEPAPAWMRMCE